MTTVLGARKSPRVPKCACLEVGGQKDGEDHQADDRLEDRERV